MTEEEIIKKLEFMLWQYSKPPQNTTAYTNFEERQALKRNIRFITQARHRNKQIK